MILDKEVEIISYKGKQGKYGSYLANIILDGLDINVWLGVNGYTTVYFP